MPKPYEYMLLAGIDYVHQIYRLVQTLALPNVLF